MDISGDGMGALVHQLYEAVQSAPAVKGNAGRHAAGPAYWISSSAIVDGSKGQLTIRAGCRPPAPPLLAKEHMNDYLIQ
jgi:hypothetical protein